MNRMIRYWPAFAVAFVAFLVTGAAAFAQEVTSNAQAIAGISTNVIMWSVLVGFFTPVLIATLNRYRWSSTTKGIIAFVISILMGGGTAYFVGDLSETKDVVTAVLVVFTAAITFYGHWFKPSGIADKIEKATG